MKNEQPHTRPRQPAGATEKAGNFYALSTSVGSGKTHAAIEYMHGGSACRRNFLYVAPTKRLIEQTANNLRSQMQKRSGMTPTNVFLIHSEHRCDENRPTSVEALEIINDTNAEEGRVVMLTTTTFISILSRINGKDRWRVILDEGFSPVDFLPYHLGRRTEDGWSYFEEVFTVDTDKGYQIRPADGCEGRVREIASGDFERAGDHAQGLLSLAKLVANPARRCEVVKTEKAVLMIDERFGLPQGVPHRSAKDDETDDSNGSVLLIASYVTPYHFKEFDEVVFMAALFDKTILYHLWSRNFGVEFKAHPFFFYWRLRDTHLEQGQHVAVGHLLHNDDSTSMLNLSRNAFTGEPDEQEPGLRVIDQIVKTTAEYFAGQSFLLQLNERYDCAAVRPENAIRIPTLSHGLNDFQGYGAVAALAVTNPNPQQTKWLMARTGLSMKDALMAYRIHTTYQAVGRSAIRCRPPTTDKKVFLTVGYQDAKFLHDLFPGSTWLGQVGTLGSLAKLTSDGKKDGITASTAKAIRQFLESLPTTVDRISSRSLKAVIDPALKKRTWAKATELAADEVSGWIRERSSFVRLSFDWFLGEDSKEETVAA